MKFQAPMPCRQMSDLPEKQAGLIHSLPSHAVLHVTAPGLAVPVLLFSYPVLLILAKNKGRGTKHEMTQEKGSGQTIRQAPVLTASPTPAAAGREIWQGASSSTHCYSVLKRKLLLTV